MELKVRLSRALKHSRWFTDKLLDEISAADDWLRRPVPAANHALWIAGHLGYATNAFIGLVDPSEKDPRQDLAKLFGKGTQALDELSAYPSPSEVTAFLTQRGGVFISLLERCTDQDLEREVPTGPEFMYDVGAVFQMAAWHESLHAGQLSIIHRMVGQSPIADR